MLQEMQAATRKQMRLMHIPSTEKYVKPRPKVKNSTFNLH